MGVTSSSGMTTTGGGGVVIMVVVVLAAPTTITTGTDSGAEEDCPKSDEREMEGEGGRGSGGTDISAK